jgi:transposase
MTLEIQGVRHVGGSNREIVARIQARYDEDSFSLRSIQNWTRRFASGDHTLEDVPRTGRPRVTEHVDEI